MTSIDKQLHDLVVANRILAHEGVVDGFGHVSMRHPDRPDRFFLSGSRSPELVTQDDLLEFDLECKPVDARGRKPYAETPIHGAAYRARPDVKAVVHSHSHELIPFSVTDVKLRPLLHLAGQIGAEIPVWDISTKFGETDLLVRNLDQGKDMTDTLKDNSVVLIRGHGATVIGKTLREAVMRSVYLMVNAKMQLHAAQLGRPIKFLSPAEVVNTTEMALSPISIDRAWEYWERRCGLTNAAG